MPAGLWGEAWPQDQGINDSTSPARPPNSLQATAQPRAWADLGLQGKGSTALLKQKILGSEANASF